MDKVKWVVMDFAFACCVVGAIASLAVGSAIGKWVLGC